VTVTLTKIRMLDLPYLDRVSFRSVAYDTLYKMLVNDPYRSAVCWSFGVGEPRVYTFDGM